MCLDGAECKNQTNVRLNQSTYESQIFAKDSLILVAFVVKNRVQNAINSEFLRSDNLQISIMATSDKRTLPVSLPENKCQVQFDLKIKDNSSAYSAASPLLCRNLVESDFYYNSTGCYSQEMNDGFIRCCCSHLSYFAMTEFCYTENNKCVL